MSKFRSFLKRNKYGAKRQNGFSSKLEAAVFQILRQKEAAGEIKNIRCQHPIHLTEAKIAYKSDFSYETSDGKTIWVEAKGFETDTWRLKKRLWKFYGPGPLEIYKGTHKKVYLDEVIIPNGKI